MGEAPRELESHRKSKEEKDSDGAGK